MSFMSFMRQWRSYSFAFMRSCFQVVLLLILSSFMAFMSSMSSMRHTLAARVRVLESFGKPFGLTPFRN